MMRPLFRWTLAVIQLEREVLCRFLILIKISMVFSNILRLIQLKVILGDLEIKVDIKRL